MFCLSLQEKHRCVCLKKLLILFEFHKTSAVSTLGQVRTINEDSGN